MALVVTVRLVSRGMSLCMRTGTVDALPRVMTNTSRKIDKHGAGERSRTFRPWSGLVLLFVIAAAGAVACTGSDGTSTPGGRAQTADDGGADAALPGTSLDPDAGSCTPCDGNCVPEIVAETNQSAFAIAQDGTLFHGGPGDAGWDLYLTSPGGTTPRMVKPHVAGIWDLLTDGNRRRIAQLQYGHLSLLDPSTGAEVDTFDTQGAATTVPSTVYAITAAGAYYVQQSGSFKYYDFTTKVETGVFEGGENLSLDFLAADETGAYALIQGERLGRVTNEGVRTLATGLSIGLWHDDYAVLGKDNVYFSGGPATSSGRRCETVQGSPRSYSLIRKVPKAGGSATSFEVPLSLSAVSVRAGDDSSLILTSLHGCGLGKDNNLFVMPSDGSAPPRRLLAPGSLTGLSKSTVQIVGPHVYFHFIRTVAGVTRGAIARVCRSL